MICQGSDTSGQRSAINDFLHIDRNVTSPLDVVAQWVKWDLTEKLGLPRRQDIFKVAQEIVRHWGMSLVVSKEKGGKCKKARLFESVLNISIQTRTGEKSSNHNRHFIMTFPF